MSSVAAVCLVQVVQPFCDRMTHMLTLFFFFFFLRSGEVLLLINSTQAEASTGAFIEKYSHVVPHMVGMTKEGVCLHVGNSRVLIKVRYGAL